MTGQEAQALLRLYGITQAEYGRFLAQYLNKKRPLSSQLTSHYFDKYRDSVFPKKFSDALNALLIERTVERLQKYPLPFQALQVKP